MKIDVVTFSVNDCVLYCDFWNPVSKIWKEVFNVHPVVLCVTDNPTAVNLSKEYGEVVFVPEVEDVPSYQSATWGRFWITSKYPDRVCMTGEIDMIPISVPFFTDNILEFDIKDYVHLYADHLSRAIWPKKFDHWRKRWNKVPAYGHIALGSTFIEVHRFEDDFESEMRKFHNFDYRYVGEHPAEGSVGGQGSYANHPEAHLRHASASLGGKWGQDEAVSTENMRLYSERGGSVKTRIPIWRSEMPCREGGFRVSNISRYTDWHAARPYLEFKVQIDQVISKIYAIEKARSAHLAGRPLWPGVSRGISSLGRYHRNAQTTFLSLFRKAEIVFWTVHNILRKFKQRLRPKSL